SLLTAIAVIIPEGVAPYINTSARLTSSIRPGDEPELPRACETDKQHNIVANNNFDNCILIFPTPNPLILPQFRHGILTVFLRMGFPSADYGITLSAIDV